MHAIAKHQGTVLIAAGSRTVQYPAFRNAVCFPRRPVRTRENSREHICPETVPVWRRSYSCYFRSRRAGSGGQGMRVRQAVDLKCGYGAKFTATSTRKTTVDDLTYDYLLEMKYDKFNGVDLLSARVNSHSTSALPAGLRFVAGNKVLSEKELEQVREGMKWY